jgi:hypothetical protein
MTHRRIYSIPLDKASHERLTKLDCYDVISIAGELGIAIITLGKLHFLLSCRLTRTNVVAVQHERCAAARSHAFDWVTPLLGVDSDVVWVRLSSGLPV